MRKVMVWMAFGIVSAGSQAALAEAPKADNTAQNLGATRTDAVTADKQRNSKNEVAVLAEVRRTIVSQKELSMDAKNIKILFSKGLITLIGPVDSVEEKTKIENLAKSCNGVSTVKNMLTIAAKQH